MNKYFQLAKRMSFLSTHPEFHIGCVLVYKNRIISTGYNTFKTDPNCPKYYKPSSNKVYQSCHAEFKAIKNYAPNWIRNRNKTPLLRDIIAYVYRSNAKGSLSMARPCVCCYKLLKQMGVNKVFYTIEGSFNEETI